MVAIIMSASVVAAIGLQAAPAVAPVDLFCMGRGDRFVTTQIKVRQPDGSMKAKSDSQRVPFNGAIRLKIAGDSGQALIPDAMLGNDEQSGWHDIKKLAVESPMITGKITFGWLFSPVMTLNTDTNTLRITGSMANFSGNCTRYTGQVAPRAPRYAAPAYASSPPSPAGAGTRPAGGDQPDPRAVARAAAMKADLAFRLFNSSGESIVELIMIGKTGTPSGNWLKSGAVMPNGFRNLNFANGSSCSHTVRVTFAGGGRTTRPIDFCGKNTLYVSNNDMWIE